MITLYYIGGPWDLTKRALPAEPVRVIVVRENDEPVYQVQETDQSNRGLKYRDHHYLTRQIARETFIAVHESIQT